VTTEPPKQAAPKKDRGFARDSLLVLLSQAAHVILNITIGIITLNVWGGKTYGDIRIALNATQIAGIVGDVGMRKVLPYELGKDEGNRDHLVGIALTLFVIMAVLMTALAAVPFLIPGLFATTWWWGVLAALLVPPTLLSNYTRGIALGIGKIGTFANIAWMTALPALLVVIFVGVVLGLDAPEHGWLRIIAAIVGWSIVGVYCLWFISRHSRLGLVFDRAKMSSMLRRGAIFAAGGVLMRLNYRVDILLLGLVVYSIPKEDITQYSIGAGLAQLVWQLPITIGYVIISRGVRATDPLAFARKTSRLVRLAILASIFAGAAIAVVAPHILPLVYRKIEGPNEIHVYVWILLPGIIAFIPAQLFEADLVAKNHPWAISIVMLPVVIVNIGLNLYLIPLDAAFGGAKGAALASTITYILGAIGMTFMYANKTGLSIAEIVVPRKADFRFKLPGRKSQP